MVCSGRAFFTGEPVLSQQGTTRVCRVLIADDAASMRMMLRMAIGGDRRLTLVGEASEGRELVELARAQQPDVVVLDLSMPPLGGLDILPEVVRNAPRARVLVLSGHSDEGMRRQALARGADGYLVKGTPLREVLETIAQLHALVAR